MIKGPFPLAPNEQSYLIPLEEPYLTPWFTGERVALRISEEDSAKCVRGPGVKGVITDLDTGLEYTVIGRPCELGPHCYCDAELIALVVRDRADHPSTA